MKTSHQRGFKANAHRNQAMTGGGAVSTLADAVMNYWTGGDFTNGNRGAAASKRGGKKFVRSRVRFHENAATRRMAADVEDG